MQNLSIDYTTESNGRILSMTYIESEGYSGELFAVYDNFGNMTDQEIIQAIQLKQ